jgi:hypothetical protein
MKGRYDEIARHQARVAFAASVNKYKTCLKCKAIDITVINGVCLSCEREDTDVETD